MTRLENINFPGVVMTINRANDQIRFTIETPEGDKAVRSICQTDQAGDQANDPATNSDQ